MITAILIWLVAGVVAGLAKMMSGAGGTKADVEKWFKIYKDKYDALKKLGENLTADQAKEMAQLQQLMNAQGDKLATGKFGDGKALGATLGTNAAIVFMGTFNALVSEKGWVAAVEALSGTFDQLKTAMGASMTPAMEAIFAQFERLQGYLNNDTFSGAISAVDGLTQVMIGLADAGYLNVETFAAMQGSAFDLFTAMVDGGMAAGDAIAVMAPLIQAAVSAAEQFGIPLSADMQHLKDLAEQNGITFKTDPMQRMVEILTAIANVLGATLPDVAAALADKVAGSEAGAAVMRATLEQLAAPGSHPVGRLLEQVESTTRTRARLALEGSTGAALVEAIRAALDQLQQSADACGFCDGDAVVHHEKCSIPDCDHEEPCPDCREVRAVLELPAFALFRSRAE
jgi:hypothetical protein